MLKAISIATLISFLGLIGCTNVVENYDSYLHKSLLKKDFTSELYQVENHEIFYYDNKREDVPVLFFIHGFGGDGKLSWINQVKYFEEDYRVIIPDILWFGRSKSNSNPELETQIEAINGLINHLEINEVHLVGISYGGFISLGIAQSNEEKLASITIVDSPGVHFSDEESLAFCEKVGVDSIANAFIPQNKDEVKRMFGFAFRKSPKLPGYIRTQTLGIYLSKNPVEQKKLLNNLPTNRERFGNLKIHEPFLILWGEDDEVFPIVDAKELQKQLDAKLIIIPKAGHGLPSEKPKAFNKELKNFIESVEK